MKKMNWYVWPLLLCLASAPAYALKGSDPERSAQIVRLLTIQDQLLPAKKQTRLDIQEQLQLSSDPDYLFVPPDYRAVLIFPNRFPYENAPNEAVLIKRAELINLLTVNAGTSAEGAATQLASIEQFSASYKQQMATALTHADQQIEALSAEMHNLRRSLAQQNEEPPQAPPAASAQGKYSALLQVMTCPADHTNYGEFRDYGYWQGGPWCGQTGQAGYWVWVNPSWYVWQKQN